MKYKCAASLWGKVDMCSITSRDDPVNLYPSGNWYCHHHNNRLSRLWVDK